jgi:hypothetical protein
VFLEDIKNNSFINLTDKTKLYKFTLESDYNDIGRFYIHTSNKILSIFDDDKTSLNVFSSGKKLFIKGIIQDADIKIFSILGKKVLHQKVKEEIALSNFKKGIYLVKIKGQKIDFSKKIVID